MSRIRTRRTGVRSPSAFGAVYRSLRSATVLYIVFLHLMACLVFFRPLQDHAKMEAWWLQFIVPLVLSCALVPVLDTIAQKKIATVILGLQCFLLLVANYPYLDAPLACVFVCILAAEIAAWFSGRLWIVLLSGAVFAILLWVRPFPILVRTVVHVAMIPLMDMMIIVGVSAGFGLICWNQRRMRERLDYQSRHVENLSYSVDNLLAANLDFQNYAVEVGTRSIMEERKRLSREIHDIVGYSLINLKMMMESAMDLAGGDNPRLTQLLEEAREEIRNGLVESRRAMRLFRDIQDQIPTGLGRVQKLVNSFSHATGIEVDINYGNAPATFGEETDAAVYRVIQESITNAFRHGHASKILIYFWVQKNTLSLSIDDNGRGSDTVTPGIGLTGMKERIDPLGGVLKVSSSKYGFSVRVEIPYPDPRMRGTV